MAHLIAVRPPGRGRCRIASSLVSVPVFLATMLVGCSSPRAIRWSRPDGDRGAARSAGAGSERAGVAPAPASAAPEQEAIVAGRPEEADGALVRTAADPGPDAGGPSG